MIDSIASDETAVAEKPKRSGRVFLIFFLAAIVVVLLVPVSNLFVAPAVGTPLAPSPGADSATLEATAILERKCAYCHIEDSGKPFYAYFPVASGMIANDVETGLKYVDMAKDLFPDDGRPVGEAALAKIEYVLERDLMPPSRYVMLHWNHGLTGEEKQTILDWIRATRRKNFAAPTASDAHRDHPLQPLPASVEVDPAKVALGNQLFHDVRLSGDDTVSCASCHALDKGGTDQRTTSIGIGGAEGPINAPTVYNSGLIFKQFWDGRAADLKAQAGGPVHNPIEMGADWETVIPKLEADAAFVEAFRKTYPAGLSGDAITDAIAEFEKTLITPNAPFDRFLAGDESALTAEQIRGHDLFVDNGCANCHVGQAVGGQSFEPMGRRADYFADRGGVQDVDQGRYNVTKLERDRHRFKVPTLRNIAQTFPYFHDGTKTSLADAVTSMAKYQAYRDFTAEETAAVVKFLESLTGEYRGQKLQ
jgi:cytochrome c peroxidase